MRPPPAFRRRFLEHNLSALLAALICLFGAIVFTRLGWILWRGGVLFLETVRHGHEAIEPPWTLAGYWGLLGVLFAWGGVRGVFRSRSGPPDRPILGLHLIEEFVLLIPNSLFSFFGNLSALRFLGAEQLEQAWGLYRRIAEARKLELSRLGLTESERARAAELLFALQLVDLVQLHTTRDSVVYLARDPDSEKVRRMLAWQPGSG